MTDKLLHARFRFHKDNPEATARAFDAFERGKVRLYLVVYHRRHRATVRVWGKGFQPTPWRCARCGAQVKHPDELLYALASLPAARRRKVGEHELAAAVAGYMREVRP